MTTGPRVGSSSVAWATPGGVITSIALGTLAGSTEQMGLAPPGAHTPNWNGCGVAAKPRAWSELNPSWPVSATANAHPEPGVPNVDSGTIRVAVRLVLSGANCALPSEALEGPT